MRPSYWAKWLVGQLFGGAGGRKNEQEHLSGACFGRLWSLFQAARIFLAKGPGELKDEYQWDLEVSDVLEAVKDMGAFIHCGRAEFFFDPQQLVVFGQA